MIFVHDVETTGLDAANSEVVEIGSVAIVGNEIVSEFSSLVNPGLDHLKYKSMDDRPELPFNHIPVADVLAAPCKEMVASLWRAWMGRWTEEATHHAYNNAFDFRFLGLEPWNISEEMRGECLMLLSTRAADRIKWQKLVDSCSRFGVSFNDGEAHRASYDARKAAEVYLELLKRRAEGVIV